MKKLFIVILTLTVSAISASAQYWQLANQATDILQTALTAGARYKGYADVSYHAGIGNNRANILDISTSHGVKLSNAFYMGVGLGVDVLFSTVPDGTPELGNIGNHGTTTTGVAIPLFSDFRLDLGTQGKTGFFADLRIGASFLTGNRYIQVGNGYLLNNECFYLKPTIGMRVPLSTSNPKLGLNVGASYILMTSDSWYCGNNGTTLNALGVSVGLEW